MQQPNDNNNQAFSYKSSSLSNIQTLREHRRERSKNININRNSVAPENIRYNTLSWVDREFNSCSNNLLFPTQLTPDNGISSEPKVVFSSTQPEDEKIIEINNINNTMNNKKKNRFKYMASPPKINRFSYGASFTNTGSDDPDSPDTSSTSPVKFFLGDKPPTYEGPQTSNQKNYGTFREPSKFNNNIPPKYESFNINQLKDPNHLFKDDQPVIPSTEYKIDINKEKQMYSPYQSDFSPISPASNTNASETHPLTQPYSNTKKPKGFVPFILFMRSWSFQILKFMPAVLLGVLLNLLDSLSYGIIIFPKHDAMPSTYVQSGISMFLVSTVVAQMVYCSGLSNFKGGNGSMMIEVMPFLHIICEIIIEKVGADRPKEVIATVMVAYALSTILTGVVFFLLGVFKLGNIMSFFPRHILIGCIGGIGLFLLQTGIEIITGYSFDLTFDYVKNIFTSPALPIWLFSMALALILTIVNSKINHPLLVPTFFITVPIIFYIVVFIGKFDLNRLREQGWLFNLVSDDGNGDVPFYTFWTYFDFKATQWSVLPYTFGTIFALAFFGILHVPINVPALSVSVNTDVDINKELKLHGFTNLFSGCIGSLQNYLVYSNSVLFIRSGGNSNIAGFLLGLATFSLLVIGTSFVKFVPTIIVGGLIFHLGFDLMKEALIDTFGIVSAIEYVTIILIVICMDIWGFTEGIIVGIIVACIFFIITLSRRKIIRSVHSGNELPSTVYRLKSQRTFLNKAGYAQIKVLRFQGFIFFGTFQQINDYVNNMIMKMDANISKFIIFDFKLVSGMDYSASEALIKIKSNLKKKKIYLVLCNLQPTSIDPLNRVGFLSLGEEEEEEDDEYFKYFINYDSAIEWCENMILETQYNAFAREYLLKTTEEGVTKIALTRENNSISLTPSHSFSSPPANVPGFTYSDESLNKYKSIVKANINEYEQPLRLLIQTLMSENNDVNMNVFVELCKFFKCSDFKESVVLWEKTTPIKENRLYIVESGQALLYSVYETSNLIIKEKVIGTLIPYSVIGDVEFFSRMSHNTKLVAQAGSKLWSIDYTNYNNLCAQHPDIALEFVQLILHCSSERMENMLKHDFIKSCY